MNVTEHIENAEALTRVFGGWPSFHDAEVLTMHLDRAGEGGASLQARVHLFLMTSEVDAQGHYVLTQNTIVTLHFANIVLRQLRWFNEQNSLFGLEIEEADPETSQGRRFGVYFGSNWGVEADLLCDRITVVSVEPFEPAA